VLVLADADTLGINLDQFAEGILKSAGDGDCSAHRQIQLRELFTGYLRGRVDTGSGLADRHHRQLPTCAGQGFLDKDLHLAAGGTVTDSDHLDSMAFDHSQQILPGLGNTPLANMGVDGNILEKAAGRVDSRQFGTGTETGIYSQYPFAACRRSQQQLAQIAGKDLDGGFVGALFAFQAQFHLD